MHLRSTIFILVVGASLVLAQNKTTAATTTAAPTNGTVVPTNGTAAPTNATSAPGTTTTASPTTTMVPTTPSPPPMTFVVNNTEGHACILEQIDAIFYMYYNMTTVDNKTTVAKANYTLPPNSVVDTNGSMCGIPGNATVNATNPTIKLTFLQRELGNSFIQVFKTEGNNTYLESITLSLNQTSVHFPNSTDLGKVVNYTGMLPKQTFMVQSGYAFACRSNETFIVNKKFNVTFSEVKVQTVGIVNSTFSEEKRCSADLTTTPMSTTSPVTATTPTPPKPKPAEWKVDNDQGKTCMLMNISMSFEIKYNTTNNQTGIVNFTLPNNGSSKASSNASSCSGDMATFILEFLDNFRLTLDFVKYKDNTYNNTLMTLDFTFTEALFPNTTDKNKTVSVATNTTGIKASVGDYYSCVSNTTTSTQSNVTFAMWEVAIQPFVSNSTKEGFGAQSQCSADQGFNNVVPIAVGCALAGLVIIVLVAYLIGRQRSSKSGYESV